MTRTTHIAAMFALAGSAAALQAGPAQAQGREGWRPMAVDRDAGLPDMGERFEALFAQQRMFDEAAPLPMHPPIDQIPFMPMPEGQDDAAGVMPQSLGMSGMTMHDATTGQTIPLAPDAPSGVIGGESVEGSYMGLAPYDPQIEMQRTFGSMTVAGGLDTWPRSGNVKLVMRFTDQGGTQRWYQASGSMADAGTVLTAAHCVYARNPNGINIFDWADIVYVYPAWDGNGNPWGPASDAVFQNFGYAYGSNYLAGTNYINSGDFDADAGLIRITRGGSRNIGMLTGWFAWAWGGSCSSIQSRTYNNFSYPAENCHDGTTMYYWSGTVDSCPGNQLQLDTGGNCLDTVWGGMSGSGMYYIDGDNRYVHAVCSNSNRADRGRYAKLWETFVNDMQDFENGTRGSAEDWEPLGFRARGSTTVQAGTAMSDFCDVAMVNATNANPPVKDYTLRVYLSSNNNISESDTQLATWIWGSRDFGAMANVNFVVPAPVIPIDTPPGTYWLGVIADSGIDGVVSNNDTDTWDAQQITVTIGLPAAASSPFPLNGSTGLNITSNLDWANAARASSYQVYFGTDSTPDATEYLGSTGSSSWSLPNLAYNTTYYWRVDTVNSAGTTTGPVWQFTTEPEPLPDLSAEVADAPSGVFYPGQNISVFHRTRNIGTLAGTGTGVNFRASTNNIISIGDYDMGTINFGGLGVGGVLQTTSVVQLPLGLPAGTYYIGTIVSEAGGSEPNYSNNYGVDTNTITVRVCPPDLAAPYGVLNIFDLQAFIGLYNAQDPRADLAAPFGTFNIFDIQTYIAQYNAGCP